MWAEYGLARNERARGQNFINNAQVPPLTLMIRNFRLTYRFREKYFLRLVSVSLIKPVS